jgi:selenocysteine lyase/cysteine desulfurase
VTPTLAGLGCYAAMRAESLRISPHLHISDDDVDRLVDGLALAVQADVPGDHS